MAAKIKTLKDNTGTDIIYPQTKAEAVFTSDNKSVEAELKTKLTTPSGNVGQLLGFTASGIGAVDAPKSGSCYDKSFTGTLGTTWQGSSAPYYQQFTIADMKNTMCPLVFPQWSSIPPNDAQTKAWGTISSAIESFDGYVRFYSQTKTTTAVNFILYYGSPT